MKLDYSYINVMGHPVFEPMVILTNMVLFILCVIYNQKLKRWGNDYAKQMGLFMLMMGIGAVFGAVNHAVHYQLGSFFFDTVLFITNAFSLFSIYFLFRATLTHSNPTGYSRTYVYLVMVWIGILLLISLIQGNFLLIKIHAGIVLVYSLIVYIIAFRKDHQSGSKTIIIGILVSFLSIIAHSIHWSPHEYFNYKDISHVIMIISLVIIYKGARLNAAHLTEANRSV